MAMLASSYLKTVKLQLLIHKVLTAWVWPEAVIHSINVETVLVFWLVGVRVNMQAQRAGYSLCVVYSAAVYP